MRFTTLRRKVARLWQRSVFVSLLVFLFLFVFGNMVSAAPPVLTDLTVSPSILQVGSGVQPVDISVQVSDPDEDLNPGTVKLVATFGDGRKEKFPLAETDDGRFIGQIALDTTVAQNIGLKIKAKDIERNRGEHIRSTIVVTQAEVVPTSMSVEQTNFTSELGQTLTLQAQVVNRDGPEVHVPNWPVTFTITSGDGILVSDASVGSLGTSSTVLTDTDGVATVQFHVGRNTRQMLTAETHGLSDVVTFTVDAVAPASPLAVAVDADGSLVVFDSFIKGIVRVNPETGEQSVLSSEKAGIGTGPRFINVMDVAIEADGGIVVGSGGIGAVLRVDPVTGDRTVISGCSVRDCDTPVGNGPPLQSPAAIAVDASGDLIVGESLIGLLRIDRATGDREIISGCTDPECTTLVGSGLRIEDLGAIVVEDDGSVLVTSSRSFMETTVVGVAHSTIGTVVRVNPVTGDRMVLSGCSEFNEEERCVSRTGSGPDLGVPMGMVIGEDGAPVVVDTVLFEPVLWRVDPITGDRTGISGCHERDPMFLFECDDVIGDGLPFVSPRGIAVEADGTLVVADFGFEKVVRVDPVTGDRRPALPRLHVGGGPGLSAQRDLVAEPEGTVIVADTLHGLLRVDPATGIRTILSGCSAPVLPGQCENPIGNGVLPRGRLAIGGDASGALFVAEQNVGRNVGMVFRVDVVTGDRTVVSGCSEQALPGSCDTPVGTGPQLLSIRALAVEPGGTVIVAALFPGALIRVDPVTGDRSIVSGCSDQNSTGPSGCSNPVGLGRLFGQSTGPGPIVVEEDGGLLVGDTVEGVVFHVNPETGDRTIVSGCTETQSDTFPDCVDELVGSGPEFLSIEGLSTDGESIFVVGGGSVIRIDRATGDRTIVSGCRERDSRLDCVSMVGAGPEFFGASSLTVQTDGSILVLNHREIIRVDPVTGNRIILSR